MPTISRFYGILIAMFYHEHAPPHFHVKYAEHHATISIQQLSLLSGRLPPRALALTLEWATKHQKELMEDWQRAARQEALMPIAPLE
jgi:hypothetical protein